MFDDVFPGHAHKRMNGGASVATENDAVDDLGAFGWLRGVQDRAIMLEIRHKDGRVTAKGYSWLQSAEFDGSNGITLNFSGETIRIAGRNLNAESRPNVRLFAGIIRHRVPVDSGGGRASHPRSRQRSGRNRRDQS